MATIYEVAARAGVSPATVSRVFNELPVSPEKIARVRSAAAELQFTPNKTARRLRNRSSEVIALLIPDIENPFFTSMARGVEDRAQQSGLSVVLCNTDDDPAKETRYLQIAAAEHMAGVILAPSSEDGDLGAFLGPGRPVVAVDRRTGNRIDAVTIDNRAIGVAATANLFAAGYRRVACIAGPAGIEATEERYLGWRAVIGRHDPGLERYLRHANYRVDGGREAMADLLSLPVPPDAVLTTNNLMGVGALQALAEVGLTPPDFGVAVVGELPFLTFDSSSITQIRLPARYLGTMAANLLIERIAGDDQPVRTVVLHAEMEPARQRTVTG